MFAQAVRACPANNREESERRLTKVDDCSWFQAFIKFATAINR
jgi:hypothetical protein